MSTSFDARPVTPHSILADRVLSLESELGRGMISIEAKKLLKEIKDLSQGLESYLTEVSSPASSRLSRLEEKTRAKDWQSAYHSGETGLLLEQEMISGTLEGQFLKLLVRLSQPREILEIGSFTGYSALAMAEGLEGCGKITGIEYDESVANFAQSYLNEAGFGERVKILHGDAKEVLVTLKGNCYDLVFIDADKQGYAAYFSALFDLCLVDSGSLIVVDNTLYQGEVYGQANLSANGAAVREFNAELRADSRVEQVLIPLRDGVTLLWVK